MSSLSKPYDVAIIGAGVAGLQAAHRLARTGARIVVLEARDRVGGRIDTRAEPDWPVAIDLGAEFVHGRSPILIDGLHAAGVKVVTQRPAHHLARQGRLGPAGRLWKRALTLASDITLAPGSPDPTVASYLGRTAWSRRGSDNERLLARSYLEGFNAADLRRASVRALLQQQRAAESIAGDTLGRPVGGYRALPLHLARLVTNEAGKKSGSPRPIVRLGTIVERIRWRPGRVVMDVRAADGVRLSKVSAALAIVTIPLGVLQAAAGSTGAIRFQPRLPVDVRAAIDALAMGNVVKVVLRFNRPPWPTHRTPTLGFLHVPRGTFPTLWTLAEGPRPVVVAWAAGPRADRLRNQDATRLRRAAVTELAGALGRAVGDLETFVDGATVAAWGDDPFSRGAYSWVPVGATHAASTLARPIAGTLIFAGEATETTGHSGTVHGALLTGERAARDALALMARR